MLLRIAVPVSVLLAASLFLLLQHVESCNEAICGSVVSKCLLTKSCNCNVKNCTCCKDCFNCLSYLYTECCSCVGRYTKTYSTEYLKTALDFIIFVQDMQDYAEGEQVSPRHFRVARNL
nr:unnamed protein product [Callosobruchus analis]